MRDADLLYREAEQARLGQDLGIDEIIPGLYADTVENMLPEQLEGAVDVLHVYAEQELGQLKELQWVSRSTTS